MTDAQIITIATTVLAVLAGALFNNVRISDLHNRFADVNIRINDMRDVIRAELQRETAGLRGLMERNQEAVLAELVRIDQRVTRLEERIH